MYSEHMGLYTAADLEGLKGEELERTAHVILGQESGVALVCALALDGLLEDGARNTNDYVVDTTMETVSRLLFDSFKRGARADYVLDNAGAES